MNFLHRPSNSRTYNQRIVHNHKENCVPIKWNLILSCASPPAVHRGAANPHQDIDKALQIRTTRGRIYIRCRRVVKIRATRARELNQALVEIASLSFSRCSDLPVREHGLRDESGSYARREYTWPLESIHLSRHRWDKPDEVSARGGRTTATQETAREEQGRQIKKGRRWR